MANENKIFGPEKRQYRAWLEFGGPGHENEYVFTTENTKDERFLREIDRAISQVLGDEWAVSNRGTRLEIINIKRFGLRDDKQVREALEEIIKSHAGYRLI